MIEWRRSPQSQSAASRSPGKSWTHTSIWASTRSRSGHSARTGLPREASGTGLYRGRVPFFYRQALSYLVEVNLGGYAIEESYATLLLTRILTPFPTSYVDLQSPAAAGRNVLVYNYDGGVYVSDEARMLAEMGDDRFRMGSVHERLKTLMESDAMRNHRGDGRCGAASRLFRVRVRAVLRRRSCVPCSDPERSGRASPDERVLSAPDRPLSAHLPAACEPRSGHHAGLPLMDDASFGLGDLASRIRGLTGAASSHPSRGPRRSRCCHPQGPDG